MYQRHRNTPANPKTAEQIKIPRTKTADTAEKPLRTPFLRFRNPLYASSLSVCTTLQMPTNVSPFSK